jgi:hypothetical protein
MKSNDNKSKQFLKSVTKKMTIVASSIMFLAFSACNITPVLPTEATLKELKLTESEVHLKISGLTQKAILERSPAEDNYQKIADVDNGRFEDKGLIKNTVYKYRLRLGDTFSKVLPSGTVGPGQVVEYPDSNTQTVEQSKSERSTRTASDLAAWKTHLESLPSWSIFAQLNQPDQAVNTKKPTIYFDTKYKKVVPSLRDAQCVRDTWVSPISNPCVAKVDDGSYNITQTIKSFIDPSNTSVLENTPGIMTQGKNVINESAVALESLGEYGNTREDVYVQSDKGPIGNRFLVPGTINGVREGMKNIIANLQQSPIVTGITEMRYKMTSVASVDQAAAALGLQFGAFGVNIKATIAASQKLDQNTAAAFYKQTAFSIFVVPKSNERDPSAWFNSNISSAEVSALKAKATAQNIPLILQQIDYGRMVFVTLTSKTSSENLTAALNIMGATGSCSNGVCGCDITGSGGACIAVNVGSVLAQSEKKVLVYGGTEAVANEAIATNDLSKYFPRETPVSTLVPIEYHYSTLGLENATIKGSSSGPYRTCTLLAQNAYGIKTAGACPAATLSLLPVQTP